MAEPVYSSHVSPINVYLILHDDFPCAGSVAFLPRTFTTTPGAIPMIGAAKCLSNYLSMYAVDKLFRIRTTAMGSCPRYARSRLV